jgi:hypothetical protein
MKLHTTKAHFNEALVLAREQEDPYREFIAAGLADLTDFIWSKVSQLDSEVKEIKRMVNSLR